MITSPLLAEPIENFDSINFPVLVSPKIDGIRCLLSPSTNQCLTRSFKDIPCDFVRETLLSYPSNFLMDGELVTYSQTMEGRILDDFNTIQSKIMSKATKPDFEFKVFDAIDLTLTGGEQEPFSKRHEYLNNIPSNKYIKPLKSIIVTDIQYFERMEKAYQIQGFEGIMARSLDGIYKQGRSTKKEGILLKYKRFLDSEARILSFHEQQKNNNPVINEVTKKRGTKKENMSPKNTLGSLTVQDIKSGTIFDISSGLTDSQREYIWKNRKKYKNSILKYSYQELTAKNLPRFPTFLGFRHEKDL